MLRRVASRVAWIGRTASMVFGLALMLALLFGVASAALGANGGNFILGQNNTASLLTRLTGQVPGKAALPVVNTTTEAGSKGIQVSVAEGKPPIQVNATAGKAPNLDSDKLDGLNADDLVRVAQVSTEMAPELTGQEQEVVSVSLTAPTDGFVLVHSNYDIVGVTQVCPCTATMHLRHGTDQQSFSRDVRNHDAMFNSGSISWVFPVTAGSHSFKLFGRTSKEDVFVVAPTIQALFTPFGSTDGGFEAMPATAPQGDSRPVPDRRG